MAYSAMDIARYVINYCIRKDRFISNLKLQKILYYIQAAFLVKLGEPCFEESISRWRHGPVVVNVYNEFSRFIGQSINEEQIKYIEYEFDDNLNIKAVTKKFDSNIIVRNDQKLIEKVVDGLIDIGPWQLVERTHEERPWKETAPNQEITVGSIMDYFSRCGREDRIYGKC